MTFYHGTTDKLQLDKVIKAPIYTGNLREDWRKKNVDKVYFTTSLLSAQKYAKKASEKYGGNAIVYEVKPIGSYNNCNTNEFIADSARIITVAAKYDKQWIMY